MANKRIYSLDFLKFIATVCIIFHHYQQLTYAIFPFGINFCNGRFYFGLLCEVFFIISGLVVAKYIPKIQSGLSFKDYYLKFFIRFAPLCGLSCIVYAVLNSIFGALYGFTLFGISSDLKTLLPSLLLIQNGWLPINPYSMNTPLWYVSVLMLCYIFLYLSAKISSRFRISPYIPLAFMLLISAVGMKCNVSLPLLDTYSGRGYFPFFCGVILGRVTDEHKPSNLCAALCGLLFVVIFYASFKKPDFFAGLPLYLTHVYSLIFLPLVVFFNSDMMSSLFRHKVFGYLGKVSFNAYVWHLPLLLFCFVMLGLIHYEPNYNNIIYMLGFGLCCYLIAMLSNKYIERPGTEFLNSFLKKHGIIS